MVTERLVGHATTLGEAFKGMRPYLKWIFAAGLASSLFLMLLQLALPPFAFFVQPLLYGPAIVVQVIALERTDLRVGLARAGVLLRGEKARVFLYLFAFAIIGSLLDLVLPRLAGAGFSYTNNDAITITLTTLAQIVVTAIIVSFIAVTMLVAYFDLRARKEDLDLAELTAEREAGG
jgi:hypothetical protein